MTYGGVDVQIHIFLTSALAGGEWSALRSGRFTPWRKSPRYPFDRGLGVSRAGVDMEKWKFLPPQGLELRPLGRHHISGQIPGRRLELRHDRFLSHLIHKSQSYWVTKETKICSQYTNVDTAMKFPNYKLYQYFNPLAYYFDFTCLHFNYKTNRSFPNKNLKKLQQNFHTGV
jgi:hypothetical protein